MVEKLRGRFIRIALIVLVSAMVLLTLSINLMNWINTRQEMDETVSFLAENNGIVSDENARIWAGRSKHRRNVISRLSYFIGTKNRQGDYVLLNQVRDESLTPEEAQDMIRRAVQSGSESGFLDDFRFQKVTNSPGGEILLFVNCENYLSAARSLLLNSALVCLLFILLALAGVILLSGRAVRPFAENEQKQKRFITDASHELKAPLTLISANMDVLAAENGRNQWITSTQNQVASMRQLVDEMVYLSRIDEGSFRPEKKPVSLSGLAREEAEAYQAMADFQGKTFETQIEPDLEIRGEENALRRLVSILCDNAVKYSPEGDSILFRLRSDGAKVMVETENMPANPMTEEQCSHLFDRFYRAEESRNREEKTGYGIGLSIAAAVARIHGGQAKAWLQNNGKLTIQVQMQR